MDTAGTRPNWMHAPRLLLCMALLCVLNMAVWAPQLAVVLEGLLRGDVDPGFANRDFANYWLSGRLAIEGDLTPLFRQETHQAALEAAFGLGGLEPRNWSYPPHFLLVTAPLGLMSYPVAYALFMIVTGAWFLGVVWLSAQRLCGEAARPIFALTLVLLIPFFCLQVLAGQNGFFFGAAMMSALLWRGKRPALAGLMIAVLTMKPQLGLLIPVLLLMERRFSTIGWTILFTASLGAVSVLFFGLDSWRGFIDGTLPYQGSVAAQWQGLFLYMMPTWFASFRAMGMESGTALLLHAMLVTPLLAACLYAMWRARSDETAGAQLLLAGTFVLTPYGFNYDLGALLAMAGLWIALRAAKNAGSWMLAAGGALVMALPLWTPLLGRPDFLLLLPPLVISGLFVVWAWPHLPAFRPLLAIRADTVS